jgi:hypothetical protein
MTLPSRFFNSAGFGASAGGGGAGVVSAGSPSDAEDVPEVGVALGGSGSDTSDAGGGGNGVVVVAAASDNAVLIVVELALLVMEDGDISGLVLPVGVAGGAVGAGAE